MVGLVQLEHDVVADVDHVVDRALTGREQAIRHPRRARSHTYSRQHDGGEARRTHRRRRCRPARGARPRRPRSSARARRTAGRATPRGRGPHRGARDNRGGCASRRRRRRRRRRGRWRRRTARRPSPSSGSTMIPEWSLPTPNSCAEHSMPSDGMPRIAARREHPSVRQRRPDGGERHQVAGREVERAAPHVVLDAVTGVDPHPVHLGRVGMGFGAQHACRHHAGARRRFAAGPRPGARGSPTRRRARRRRRANGANSRSHDSTTFMRTAPRSGCRR